MDTSPTEKPDMLRSLERENRSASGWTQHRRTKKEVRIGRYFTDRVDENTNTIYEYNG